MFQRVQIGHFSKFSNASLPIAQNNTSIRGIEQDSLHTGVILALYGDSILRITDSTVSDLLHASYLISEWMSKIHK